MLQLYFQNEDPDFDLLFDSPEDGQTYVDKYKASILANGSKVLAERVNFAPQPQSSMSVIDQHTGYVKALIGGRGEKTASLTLNRATDTTRQPGSTFKIVSTYAPALNEKGMTLATTFEDEPYEYPDGSPVNNATRSYNGTTTIRTAIQNSINVVAVKCLEKVTPDLGLKYLTTLVLQPLLMEQRLTKMPMVMYGAMQTLPLRLAASPAVSQMLNCVHPMQPSQMAEIISSQFITQKFWITTETS